MKKNIFLTGPASAGKTAVIKQVIEKLNVPAKGFYVEDEKKGLARVGLVIKTLDGRQGFLAHKAIESVFSMGKYGVSISNIDDLAVPSIAPCRGEIIILDGIGKMVCFSETFRRAVITALNSSCVVIGTITQGGNDLAMKIKNRKDVELHEVTWNNRKLLPDFVLRRISELLDCSGNKFPRINERMENTAGLTARPCRR